MTHGTDRRDSVLSFKDIKDLPKTLNQSEADEYVEKMLKAIDVESKNCKGSEKIPLLSFIYKHKETERNKSTENVEFDSTFYWTKKFPEEFPSCFISCKNSLIEKSEVNLLVKLYRGSEQLDDTLDIYCCPCEPYNELINHLSLCYSSYCSRLKEIEDKMNSDTTCNYHVVPRMPECYVENSFYYTNDINLQRSSIHSDDYLTQVQNIANIVNGVRKKQDSLTRRSIQFNIKSFYDSLYTHTLSWAVKSKEAHIATKQPEFKSSPWFNHLDGFVRNCKNQETKGIINGPIVFHNIAELYLRVIDLDIYNLCIENSIPAVLRRGDKIEFFLDTLTEDTKRKLKLKLRKVLTAYRLDLNSGSTQSDGEMLAVSLNGKNPFSIPNGNDEQLAGHVYFSINLDMSNDLLLALFKNEMSSMPCVFAHLIKHDKRNDELFAKCLTVFEHHWQYQATVQCLHFLWYAIVFQIPLDFSPSNFRLSNLQFSHFIDTCKTLEYPCNCLAYAYEAIINKSLVIKADLSNYELATIEKLDLKPVIRIAVDTTHTSDRSDEFIKCLIDSGLKASLYEPDKAYTHKIDLHLGKENWDDFKNMVPFKPFKCYLEKWNGDVDSDFITAIFGCLKVKRCK